MVLDDDDAPHISYRAGLVGTPSIRLASWQEPQWVVETVDAEAGLIANFTALVVDSTNQMHITYFDSSDGLVLYAEPSGTSWDLQSIAAVGTGEDIHSAVVVHESTGRHIEFYDGANERLVYMRPVLIGMTGEISLADHYRQFHRVEIDEGSIEDTFHQGCDRLAEVVGQQMLFADLSHDDQRVFASQKLRIAPLDEGVDVYTVYLTDEPAPDFCVSKASHIAVHWGDWFAELEVVCRAEELVHYEIGDFLDLLDGVFEDPERPEEVLVSHCGQMKMEPVSFEELLQNAAESRQLWGQSYPERREQ